jgi:hypothetical protein
LVAARELLHNPPDTAASPDMLRQWRDDVDHLLNLAYVKRPPIREDLKVMLY